MAPMFIPRAQCSVSCSPDADTSSGFDPTFMGEQGPQRFIGVAMVAALIFIIFLVWLYRGRWPRRMLQQHCCCCRRLKELPKPTDDETPPTQTRSSEKDNSPQGDSDQLVKEVSAGMVVYTKVPKALRAKDRHAEWEMDHVNGIRLETRTPPYQARNGSR